MTFASLEFFIFLPTVFTLYWLLAKRGYRTQNAFLIGTSLFFYGWWDIRFLPLLIVSALIDYFGGLAIANTQEKRKRKRRLAITLSGNLVILGFFKYYNFFVSSAAAALSSFGVSAGALVTLPIILPIGISFYTFQSMSYSIEAYRGTLTPTRNIVDYLAYVSFFPQLVAGPIERATHLLPQFQKERIFNYALAVDGTERILWGIVKKMVLADNLGMVVSKVFDALPSATSWELLVVVLFFSFQIYTDFSAYSDIAIGTGQLFGFSLMENFRYPYFSRDIVEFWRRWHISLTSWFRAYLYIPLGGNRGSTPLAIRTILIVFLVSGLWHGASWNFILWGLIHALLFIPIALENKTRPREYSSEPSWRDLPKIAVMFGAVSFAWIFFRANTLGDALFVVRAILGKGLLSFPGIETLYPKRIASIAALVAVEWFSRTKTHPLAAISRVKAIRYMTYYGLALLVFLAGAFGYSPFLYFQF